MKTNIKKSVKPSKGKKSHSSKAKVKSVSSVSLISKKTRSPRKALHETRGVKAGKVKRSGFQPGNKLATKNKGIPRPTNVGSIPAILREIGDTQIAEFVTPWRVYKNVSLKFALHLAAYEEAVYKRQPWAVEYIAERTEGKIVQPLGLPDEAIIIKYIDN